MFRANAGPTSVTTGAGFVWLATEGGEGDVVDPTTDMVTGAADRPGRFGYFFP